MGKCFGGNEVGKNVKGIWTGRGWVGGRGDGGVGGGVKQQLGCMEG